MFYLPGGSFLWLALFCAALVYLNTKINRLSKRLDKIVSAGKADTKTTAASAVPPFASKTATPSAPTPFMETPAASGVSSQPVARRDEQTGGQKLEPVDREEASSRWLGKIGVLAIVLGVSFFLKWAFDNNFIGPMGRIVLGIGGGTALVFIGQFLRKKYLVYSDIVSGGGIAILYLTIFAAFVFYNFIGFGVATVLMLAVTALSVTLSVLGGTEHLAVLGVFGGFLTPLLINAGTDNFFSLMSYLVVLDIGVLGVAAFKKWQKLNLLGFIGTAALFFGWLVRFYGEEKLFPTFGFLSVFFLIYVCAGIVHNVLWRKDSTGKDLILVTLVPAAYGYMSYVLLNPSYESVMGFFMLGIAVLYLALAFVAYRMNQSDRTLNFYLPGIAVIFLTVAMPLQFSGHWITLAWLLEAALLALAGSFARRHSMNVFAVTVYAVGLIRYFSFDVRATNVAEHTPIFNTQVFLALAAIVVAYVIAVMLTRHGEEEDAGGRKQAAAVFFVVAHLLSLYIITAEVHTYYAREMRAEAQRFSAVSNGFRQIAGERSERQEAELREQERSSFEHTQSLRNRRNTIVSIAWALYAALLTAIGFVAKRRLVRILGLVLLFVTFFKVLADVWALGELYRIISSITFGVIALVVSFAYAKWRHRLKEVL